MDQVSAPVSLMPTGHQGIYHLVFLVHFPIKFVRRHRVLVLVPKKLLIEEQYKTS